MKIQKFLSVELNGYLNFDIDFFSTKKFLIGINGSGKTNVLKAIMGLISPDIDWIMNAKFQMVSVSLEHEGEIFSISATNAADGKNLLLLRNDEIQSSVMISNAEYHSMMRRSHETMYNEDGEPIRLSETSAEFSMNIDLIREIRKLPTPLFLGLDRSNLPFSRNSVPRRMRPSRIPHATLRAFLDESVSHAENAVSHARVRANVERQRRASRLREDMLLTLFSVPKGRQTNITKKIDLQKFDKYRKNLKKAFKVLGLNQINVENTVDPFFSDLIGAASYLIERDSFQDLYTGKN